MLNFNQSVMNHSIKSMLLKLKYRFTTPRKKLIYFMILFAVIGTIALLFAKAATPSVSVEVEDSTLSGGVAKVTGDASASGGGYVEFGVSPQPITSSATVLTIEATDGITSNATCIDTKADGSTACIQVNPSNTSQARGGTYDITNKQFVAATGWSNLLDLTSASRITGKVCSNSNHAFAGLGPLSISGVSVYYGEEISGASASFGTLQASTSVCTSSAGGTLDMAQWATPAIYCSSGATQISSTAQLQASVSQAAGTEFCLAPGHYVLSSTLKPKDTMKFIGDPLQRADVDATNIPGSVSGDVTSSFSNGSNVTIANVIVRNSHTPGRIACNTCGFGINGGGGYHVYNVKMTNNEQNGFHYHSPGNPLGFLVENSEISNNGNLGDVGQTSGGIKTTHNGELRHNVANNNLGVGLWCDVGCDGGIWKVSNNYAFGNSRAGIRYETSYAGANITNNVLTRNVTSALPGQTYNGGLALVLSKDVVVSSNIFHSNLANGIYAADDAGRPDSEASSNISITNNTMNGDRVSCITRIPIICIPNN